MTCASVASGAFLWSVIAHADIPLTDKEKTGGWEVVLSGRVDAYLSWITGETVSRTTAEGGAAGNLVDESMGPGSQRYTLIGPAVGIQGYPVPSGATEDPINDKKLNTMRIRGGFASTILTFNITKQISEDVKLTVRMGMWAGIQNGLTNTPAGALRLQNDAAPVDWREQYMQLDGPWGSLWGGRKVGLYNRGGMRMNWLLIHQHGVGHPCNVDSSGTATCGHTGVGSMFPNRNAQIGYATPDLSGFQLNIAMLDPSMLDPVKPSADQQFWARTTTPRIETEATFKQGLGGKDELNVWANGLTQVIGRSREQAADPANGVQEIPADATRNIFGVGGGAWARLGPVAFGGTGWWGKGLGTATAFGNTAIDANGTLRTHFGYLGVANFRQGDFEVAASYGSTNCQETGWDKDPGNTAFISVIKEVRGIGGKVAYHMGPVTFSVDGMNVRNKWWRGEQQVANVVSGGMLAEF
jgi:hypothetical protein